MQVFGFGPDSAFVIFNSLYFGEFGSNNLRTFSFEVDHDPLTIVPLPAALPLFGTGLAMLGFMGWRRKRKAA